jgi:hypothetical protein
LKLIDPNLDSNELVTVDEVEADNYPNILEPVFENGIILRQDTWDEVKSRT